MFCVNDENVSPLTKTILDKILSTNDDKQVSLFKETILLTQGQQNYHILWS